MSFYLRKRVTIMPGLNLNISKSGLGLSTGLTGLRVSRGPRGMQVNAGRDGVYYRKNLNGRKGGQPIRQRRDGTACWMVVAIVAGILLLALL